MQGIEGLVETSPGVRSCMIEYDQRRLPLRKLLDILLKTEQQLPKVGSLGFLCPAYADFLLCTHTLHAVIVPGSKGILVSYYVRKV